MKKPPRSDYELDIIIARAVGTDDADTGPAERLLSQFAECVERGEPVDERLLAYLARAFRTTIAGKSIAHTTSGSAKSPKLDLGRDLGRALGLTKAGQRGRRAGSTGGSLTPGDKDEFRQEALSQLASGNSPTTIVNRLAASVVVPEERYGEGRARKLVERTIATFKEADQEERARDYYGADARIATRFGIDESAVRKIRGALAKF